MSRLIVTATLSLCSLLAATQTGPARRAHSSPSGVKCQLERVRDEGASKLVAFTYLVPEGWTAHSVMRWVAPGAFNANLSATTPDKHYSVDQLQRFVATYGIMLNPQTGATVQAKGIVIHHATDFLHAMVEQLKRQYGVGDVEVVEETDKPLTFPKGSLEEKIAQTINTDDPMGTRRGLNEVGFLQVKFDLDGVPTTAALGTSVSGSVSIKHLPGRPNAVTSEGGVFAVGPTTVLMGPTSPPARKVKEMQIVASSMAMTPQFNDYMVRLTTHLAKAVIHANEIGQIEADRNWHERSMARFRGEMDQKDALTHQFCNYIQDQQDYKDRRGSTVTLPASYKHVWDDGQGHYLLTDDPTIDPRGLGSGDWKPMDKARAGE